MSKQKPGLQSISKPLAIATMLFLNGLAWLAGSPGRAAGTGVGGPYGSTYDFELLTGEHASGSTNLYRYSTGPSGFTLHFDGVSESLPSYCCGLGTTPLVTESFTANGDGTSTVEIIATSPNGSDLYPSGLVGTADVPLTDAALRIGYFSGSIPLTWTPSHTVLSATVDMLSNGASILGGPAALDPATFFGAPGPWDGNLVVVFQNLAGEGVNRVILKIIVPNPQPTTCEPGTDHLCLNGSRFRVDATWKKVTGETGSGHAVGLTTDTGYFWFFSESNVEAVIKVLDACTLNGKFWVFAAGLTNVQTTITVTDSLTNTKQVYTNPQGTPFQPIQDTTAFATCGAQPAANQPAPFLLAGSPPSTHSTSVQQDLLLRGGRFLVHTVWTKPTGETGTGTGVALTNDTGYFWFFSESNVELVLKVLDGCALNRRNWVFAGGLTNVKVVVTVTDTLTGDVETFTNPQGRAFAPIQKTQTSLISTTCLPKCADQSFTQATIKQAVDKAIAGMQAPFGDDFGRVMARISDQLLCGVLDEAAFSPIRTKSELPEALGIAQKTDPIYNSKVNYCGKGDSTNSWLVAPTGDSCLNRACHDHDLCYQHFCLPTSCYFCPRSTAAALCDIDLMSACINCPSLGVVGYIVCTLVFEIPLIQVFDPLCSGPPCATGQTCNRSSGKCESPTCNYSLDELSHSFGASASAGVVSVTETADSHCTWTAVSADNWITVLPPSSYSASAQVTYVLEANLGNGSRTGTIFIADKAFSVTQAGSGSCSFSLDSASQAFGSSGGFGSVNVTAPSGCAWTAVSNANWITITQGSGTGNDTVLYSVEANADASPRTGTLTIAGLTFTITEDGAPSPCNTQQFNGGDTPETHTVEMGRASGTFTFDYNTYSIPDQMVVQYEGRILFDTGCVGTSDSVTLTYSGTSTEITVQVTPNCNGTSGTQWDFTVECPR